MSTFKKISKVNLAERAKRSLKNKKQPNARIKTTQILEIKRQRRKTIGFFYNYQTPLASNNLLRGLEDYAKENELNILCAVGAPFKSTSETDKFRIRIFDCLSKKNADGFILSRKVGRSLSSEEIKNFLQKFWPYPTVNIGAQVKGVPSVLYSIPDSIKEIVRHLVLDHGYKKILFIRGRETNKYARLRFESFCEAMKNLNLSVYYIEPSVNDYYYEGGRDAIRILIEEKQKKFEAIVAENNLMALGILDALRSYQLDVPKDIAVVGIYELEADSPFEIPLTSIYVPFYDHGRISARLCHERIKGKISSPAIITGSDLKIGTSCGCFFPELKNLTEDLSKAKSKADFEKYFKEILGCELTNQNRKMLFIKNFTESLIKALKDEIKEKKPKALINVLKNYTNVFRQEGLDLLLIQKTLNNLYQQMQNEFNNDMERRELKVYLAKLFYLVYRIYHNEEAYHFLVENQKALILSRLTEKLFTTQTLEQLRKIVETDFISFGVKTFFLANYDPQKGQPFVNCELALINGKPFDFKLKKIRSDVFIKKACQKLNYRFTILAAPLFYGEEELGFALFEIEDNDLNTLEKLRVGLSYALLNIAKYTSLRDKTITLETALIERNQELEKINEKLKIEIITRKNAELKLKKSEEEYRRWFNESFTADFVADETGKILLCNPAFARIFGFSSVKEAQKASFTDFYPVASAVEDFFTMLKVVKKIEYYEAELKTVKGQKINIIGHIIGIFNKSAKLIGMRGYLVDNTAHKILEEELRQSQKMDAIGRLSGGIAHDFNNLLTGIMGYSELLLQSIPENNPARKEVEEIKRAAKSASSLTRQLLAFSRKQVLSPQVLNLNEIIKGMAEMLTRLLGEDINLRLDLRENLYPLKADRGQLEQVIMNLVINSRDALPSGGEIVIRTTNISVGESIHLHQNLLKAGEYVLMEVIDNGIGMDEKTLGHLFEPFFTTKSLGKGVGLGLSTVYGIVTQSGGCPEVKSKLGEGTSVRIYLPRYNEEIKLKTEDNSKQEFQLKKGRILLVEDDRNIRELVMLALTKVGFEVKSAADGEEALAVFRGEKSKFDFLIADVILPKMSGPDLLKLLKAEQADLKVIFISGYISPPEALKIKLDANTIFIQKPFMKEDLLIAIERLQSSI